MSKRRVPLTIAYLFQSPLLINAMRYTNLLTALLAAALFTACSGPRAMQERIDTLEARVTELEARPVVWPIEIVDKQPPASTDRPWWDPAPTYHRLNYAFDSFSISWEFPGFELHLIDETARRLALGPTQQRAMDDISWDDYDRWMLHRWKNQWHSDADPGTFGAIVLPQREYAIVLDALAPPHEMGTFRLPEDR